MRRVVVSLLALTLCVGCVESTDKTTQSTQSTTEQTTQSRVVTKSAPAVAEEVTKLEVFTSEIEPLWENDIIPAASGVRVAQILFDVGDRVTEGELVATLDPTLYNQQMISVNNLRADYERLLPVYEAGGISRQTLDQAKAALDVQSEVAANIKKNIELRAPISGVVSERDMKVGDLFINTPIMHIVNLDTMQIVAKISESYFTQVRVGMAVDVTLDIYPDEIFRGEVSLIYPTLDPATRTFTVEVSIPNRGDMLRPGMFGRAEFDMGSKAGIMVPDVAVQKQYGSAERYVYVVEDGVASRRTVDVGRRVGDKFDILSGVEVGDQVIITAFSRITDGTEVTIVE